MSRARATEPPVDGPVWAEPPWWWAGYAIRLAGAVIVASVIVGAVVGPGMIVMIAWIDRDARTVWSMSPADIWAFSAIHIQAGLALAGGTSFFAVLLGTRRTAAAILRRMLSGPLIAGVGLLFVGIAWQSGAGIVASIAATLCACAVFVGMTLLAGLTRTERPRSTPTTGS